MTSESTPLVNAINTEMEKMNLQPEEALIKKILQFHDTLDVRHGLMLVGLPYSGKSTIYKILAGALNELAKNNNIDNNQQGLNGSHNSLGVKTAVINPKSITIGQLYGNFDAISHEWTDGILPYKFREMANENNNIQLTDSNKIERKWLIMDGPVDAIWIENLNTVLDDNKKLCLMSGQIIHMAPYMNMIFEVRDLSVASPATVSRCGMIYLEPQNLGWRCLMISWLKTLPAGIDDKAKKRLETLFDWLVSPCLRYIQTECQNYININEISLVKNLMNIFESTANHEQAFSDPKKVEEMGLVRFVTLLESIFLFSLIWSIGASVDTEGRKKFDKFLREVCREVNFYRRVSFMIITLIVKLDVGCIGVNY
jgi:dynein heavy chain